jgi:membrane-associated protease RseP (regulator of RpoE activity)
VTASAPEAPPLAPLRWRRPLVLFVATVISILYTGAALASGEGPLRLVNGIPFTIALLSILLTHEFAHFIFARHYGVNASLPFFIPMPIVSPFGTMGAVIFMRDRIKSRNALLDIGASGPIAGMIVALPVLLYGLSISKVAPLTPGGVQEGQSLLYLLLKRITVGPIPEGYDVYLHPVAFAGWVGLFVTMLNLVPVGQLDGGHVAYALFGPRQNDYSRIVRWSLLVFAVLHFAWGIFPVLRGVPYDTLLGNAISSSMMWATWFVLLSLLERASGGRHPPTEPGTLSPARRAIAVGSLVLFVLLFMPTPMTAN